MPKKRMTLQEMQDEIISNRIRRGFPSAYDLHKTTKGLKEELLEWEDALEKGSIEDQVDALGDIMIFCLGGLAILKADAQAVLEKIVAENRTRVHKKIH